MKYKPGTLIKGKIDNMPRIVLGIAEDLLAEDLLQDCSGIGNWCVLHDPQKTYPRVCRDKAGNRQRHWYLLPEYTLDENYTVICEGGVE